MDLGLSGKSVFVAGSSRGIGKAIVQAFVAEGARVCISGRDPAALENARNETGAASAFAGDLCDSSTTGAAISAFTPLDVLVCNLGSGSGRPGWDQPEEEWTRLFQINFQASVQLAQRAMPELIHTCGSILFVASITGIEATPAPLPYSAAKAALVNYSKNLARQAAPHGVRVNCLAPGNVLFPGGSWERHLERDREGVMKRIEAEVPLRRFGTPEEIAALAVFLSSPRASFITGSCFVADGGQTKSI